MQKNFKINSQLRIKSWFKVTSAMTFFNKIKGYFQFAFCFILISFIFIRCSDDYTPKPRGYFRLSFPPHQYERFDPEGCNFSFEKGIYTTISKDSSSMSQPCWYNVDYVKFHGQINLTYRELNNDLQRHFQDCYDLVYKHAVKADDIEPRVIANSDSTASGLYYEIEGNAACSVQFYITDSTNHFLRGALYFYAAPNYDSLAPSINFCKQDIEHLIKTLKWKN